MPRGNKDGDEVAVEHLLGATLIPNEAIVESSQSREPRDEDMKNLGKMCLDGDLGLRRGLVSKRSYVGQVARTGT